jgi:hypothetical protein
MSFEKSIGHLFFKKEKFPSCASVENIVTVHDLHATMLHLLGIDHNSFTYKFQGLDAKLSGVEKSTVVKGLLA